MTKGIKTGGRQKVKEEADPKPKANRGRPPKLVEDKKTIATISELAKIQCTHQEAAGVLGVTKPTFREFLSSHIKAREAWENGLENGKASLRRKQFAMAETNAAMAIWLGKQYLGQSDKQELSGPGGGPIPCSWLTQAEAKKLGWA